MLKTRRQRSFWARIKLSIILFQTPRRVPDFSTMLSKSRFLIFRNVDSKKKILYKIYKILHTSLFLHSLFYAYFPYQRFCSLALSSFPSLYSQRSLCFTAFCSQQALKNISQNHLFCQASFYLFFNFFHSLKKRKEAVFNTLFTYRVIIMYNKLHQFYPACQTTTCLRQKHYKTHPSAASTQQV